MLEREVEQPLIRAAERRGGAAYKLVPLGRAGFPDRTILLRGRVAFVECKAPGKKASNLQQWWLDKLTALGFVARVMDHPDQIEPFFAEVFGA